MRTGDLDLDLDVEVDMDPWSLDRSSDRAGGGRRHRATVAWPSLALLMLAGCGAEARYELVLVASGTGVVDQGFIWEVAASPGECTAELMSGEAPPAGAVAELRFISGGALPTLADLAPGSLAFSARVLDESCAVRWAGCAVHPVEAGGEGRLEIPLAEVDGPKCIDNLACNGAESCQAERGCVLGEAPSCDDHLPCTMDQCAEPDGRCLHLPLHAACPDGQLCGAAGCAQGRSCTAGGESCSDGLRCNGEERCAEGRCVRDPAAPCASEHGSCPDSGACDMLTDRCVDRDHDGWSCDLDCNDQRTGIHPEALELCNTLDDDCDQLIDELEVCHG